MRSWTLVGSDRAMATHVWTASRLFFAVTMIGIGLIGLVRGSFAGIWGGVPQTLPGRDALTYLCAFVSLATGAGMLWKRSSAPAALSLFVYLLVWTLAFKVPPIVKAPLVEVNYQSCGENVVLIAAAWVLYARCASERRINFLAGGLALRAALVLYGLALLAFGLSHFFYLNLTAALVPKWLPMPNFWAYLTGSIYLATGLAIVTGIGAQLAATAVAIQITLITLLVWGPSLLGGDLTPANLAESIVSWALTVGAWVLASSFGAPGSAAHIKRRSDDRLAPAGV